jgi:hypothetical protein
LALLENDFIEIRIMLPSVKSFSRWGLDMRYLVIPFLTLTLSSMSSIPAVAGDAKFKIKTGPGQTVPMDPAQDDGKVNADFPEPTDVRDIAKAFSLWTGKDYVVDESVQAKVKLISPELVTKEEALARFYRMLASYNLKSVPEESGYRIKATKPVR